MPLTPLTPAAYFDRLIDGLCRAVAARGLARGLAGPVLVLIVSRLRGLAVRFASLAARIEAGRVRRILFRRRPGPTARRPALRPLPQSHAWLVRLLPEAASSGAQLQHLLAAPEMAALAEAAPQMRRLLRPLCRMLGVRPPAIVALPPPARPGSPARPARAGRTSPAASPPGPTPRRMAPGPAPPIPRRACGPPACAA